MELLKPSNENNNKLLETLKNPGFDYTPDFWNDAKRGGKIQSTVNCYAYSLNLFKNPFSNEYFSSSIFGNPSLQPGDLAGHDFDLENDLDKDELIALAKWDLESNGGKLVKAEEGSTCPDGWWKIALAVDPEKNYHWYRQHSDGTWSHKPGVCEVTNLDSSGNVITDPKTCNRNYKLRESDSRSNYSEFCGYFYITHSLK